MSTTTCDQEAIVATLAAAAGTESYDEPISKENTSFPNDFENQQTRSATNIDVSEIILVTNFQ